MNEQKFTELLGGIDPALVARAEQSVPMRKKPIFKRVLIAAVAAMLAMSMLLGAAAIALIPKTYDLDYEVPKHEHANKLTQIFYTENGKIKRQNVLLPPTEQNVFMTWKHLNTVGDEVKIVNYAVQTDDAQATVVPGTLWEYLQQTFSPASGTVTVTLSPEITSYENYDALIESLTETFAKYSGIDPEQVKILIDGEQSILIGGLKFYHILQEQPVFAGGQFDIRVGMTNVSDYDIEFTGAWSDFAPKAKLRAASMIYVEQLLLPLPNDSTTEIAEYRLAPGESREITYTFEIPADAPTGSYDLILSFGESSMTFEGAVEVVVFSEPAIGTLEFYHAPSGISTTLGSTVSISVGMLNISDVPLYFTGPRSEFVPDAVLHMDDIVIHHDDRELTGEYDTHMCRVGEAIEVTHIFQIPNDIPAGAYDLTISFAGQSLTLKEAVIILCREEIDTPFDPDTLFDYEMQYKPTYEDYLQIREGMTVEEVVAILGKPHGLDAAVGSKYLCWTTADGASCAIKVTSPNATEGWTDWADILQPHYGGATVVHHNYYGSVSDEDG